MMSVIRKFPLFFFFFWLIAVRARRKTAVNQLSSKRHPGQTVSRNFFFSLLWVWSFTEGVSKSICGCSLSPITDSRWDYLTRERNRNQPPYSLSHWSHRGCCCVYKLSSYPFALFERGLSGGGCRLRQPGAHERSGGCKSCVRWLRGERKHLPSIPLFD